MTKKTTKPSDAATLDTALDALSEAEKTELAALLEEKARREGKPSRQLRLVVAEGDDVLEATAKQAQAPVTKAAAIATGGLLKPIFGDLDLMASIRVMQRSIEEVQSGDMRQADAMLVSQAQTLDSVFTECLRMWMANQFTNHGPAQEYLRMAMKAQTQARTTWETLSKIHNPPQPTFIRQANVANGPQQVNNGVQEEATARAKETQIKPNELNRVTYEPAVDTGATASHVGGGEAVEAVGAIDGAAHG